MIEFPIKGGTATGYLALPERGAGPAVLVLHAWWGLKPFFKELCDRLAGEGFVALAPDLYGGQTAATIEEAEQLISTLNPQATRAKVTGATAYLRRHPAVQGDGIGVIGFSMGGAWALLLSTLAPDDISAAVIFYGSGDGDFTVARAAYLAHYAENDEWEPIEDVRQVETNLRAAGREVTLHTYPGTQHWFFEADRPEYRPEAAELAWRRTLDFLREHLAAA
jgi:carboxymethylenebutenolidase